MKRLLVHHRSQHHASISGYDRLVGYIDGQLISGQQFILPYRMAKFIAQSHNQNKGIYNSSSVYKDIHLFKALFPFFNNDDVIHYLHGERDIRSIFKMKFLLKQSVVCATFHKPPEILKTQIPNPKVLKKLNGAIAVGQNQVDFLKEWLGLKTVEYIPHGVDVNFFKPGGIEKRNNRLLFVGQHLRDFEALNFCAPVLTNKIKDLKIDVVLRKDFYDKVNEHEVITMHSNIDDAKLKGLYQKADLLFLPLLDVTACNSILEAMACGLPIITTNVGGNTDYLANTENVMVSKNNHEQLIEQTTMLLKDEEMLLKMGKSSREKALEYSWESIGKRVLNYYKKLC
ncbi:glycosyltransferase family 4 protein [Aestuariivivens sp. NBU2969]|uniref:glycosyltransferase family 4 protein n=1 Tax=Aestuariivivens sp. NBU2969 TaxID=2873267 RepID=UPI001CBE2A3A|nr:glycosyltransferase family 4 protein [Aestuariivivens sp. NBU2969]